MYQNKVTASLASTHNCKMAYSKLDYLIIVNVLSYSSFLHIAPIRGRFIIFSQLHIIYACRYMVYI